MGKDPNIALTTTGNPDYQNMILESEFSKPNAEGLFGEALNTHYKSVKLASQK
jgi:hypothetical protein